MQNSCSGPSSAVSVVLNPQLDLYQSVLKYNYADVGFVLRIAADQRSIYPDAEVQLAPGRLLFVETSARSDL